jgi:replicative DNA helicase
VAAKGRVTLRQAQDAALPGTVPDKLQPHNVEAEEAVMGGLLYNQDTLIQVEKILEPGDFYVTRNTWIYQAILDLHHRGVPSDMVTLSDELARRNQLEEIGGPAHLTELTLATPTSLHIEHHAWIVARTAALRRLIKAAGQAVELAYNSGDEVDVILDQAQSILVPVFALGRKSKGTIHIARPLNDLMEKIDLMVQGGGAPIGLPTGLKDLDLILGGGLQGTDFVILAGRPGMGKTSLALGIALHAARRFAQRIAIFSLEMSDEQLILRLLAAESGIDSQRLRLGKIAEPEWPVFTQSSQVLSEIPIYINDTAAISIFELRNEAMRLAAEVGLDMLIIDYIQLMRGSGARNQNRQEEISEISRGLKALAKELRIPVLGLSQLNRDLEGRKDKRPRLSDLRESGSLEQDADVVMFIYRDEEYNPDTEFPNIAEIILGKHRSGPTGIFSVYFKKHLTQFVDLEVRYKPLEY